MSTAGKRDWNMRLVRYGRLRALLGEEGLIYRFNTASLAPQTASPTLQVRMLQDRLPPPLSPPQLSNSSWAYSNPAKERQYQRVSALMGKFNLTK